MRTVASIYPAGSSVLQLGPGGGSVVKQLDGLNFIHDLTQNLLDTADLDMDDAVVLRDDVPIMEIMYLGPALKVEKWGQ